jgi:hypothetical protein
VVVGREKAVNSDGFARLDQLPNVRLCVKELVLTILRSYIGINNERALYSYYRRTLGSEIRPAGQNFASGF